MKSSFSSTIIGSSILAAILFLPSASYAFLNLPFINQANPALANYAAAQEDALLKIHLDIGQVDVAKSGSSGRGGGGGGGVVMTGNRLGIDGLLLELHGNQIANYIHPKMPGADGPNPQLSTGAKALNILKPGKYVDLTGSKSISLEHGVWEMIWRRNANAGALICGFDVPTEVTRNNGASIPKGRMYVTFPVWTEETLQDLRQRKIKAEEIAVECMERLKEETRKMEETNNPLMKAMHFRNACKAHEEIDYSGYRSYNAMPLERDMITLKNGLHLCSLGTVWTKKDGFFGGDHVLLGTASAMAGVREELNEKKAVTERELKAVAFDGLRPFE
ncbi:hypothetical protein ACHAWU_007364 [Discostella pseudostelligera]|uniref:Uncharacterized protein n=1 Tax=Discostella pseudostelligera TaxID=259834 RepID=A0ABD3MBD0_9STRA